MWTLLPGVPMTGRTPKRPVATALSPQPDFGYGGLRALSQENLNIPAERKLDGIAKLWLKLAYQTSSLQKTGPDRNVSSAQEEHR